MVVTLPNRYGSSFPGDFFTSIELNSRRPFAYDNVDKLWNVLSEEQHLPHGDVTTSRHLRRDTAVGALLFRGQSNHGYGISSSLHRLVARESKEVLTESLLGEVEKAILNEAASHGLAKNVSPGELLMILQHHWAPTRLLDVSIKPLEALYFAVEGNDATDGRLFVIWLNDQTNIELSGLTDLPWTKHVRPGGQAASDWTQAVQLVDEKPLDPRMIAQQGRFLVGGLQRAYMNLNMWHIDQLRVSERQKISMLSIGFFKKPQSSMPRTKWPALGWTIRIPAGWKSELRERLKSENISHDSMYPELSSIEWRAQRAARDFLSSGSAVI